MTPAGTRARASPRLPASATAAPPPFVSRFAMVSVLARRRVSACALPRPSARASAKLANSTVNQSQAATCPVKSGLPAPPASSWTRMIVVTRLPTSTMNITGFRNWIRGASLRTASAAARRRRAGSQIEIVRVRSDIWILVA